MDLYQKICTNVYIYRTMPLVNYCNNRYVEGIRGKSTLPWDPASQDITILSGTAGRIVVNFSNYYKANAGGA